MSDYGLGGFGGMQHDLLGMLGSHGGKNAKDMTPEERAEIDKFLLTDEELKELCDPNTIDEAYLRFLQYGYNNEGKPFELKDPSCLDNLSELNFIDFSGMDEEEKNRVFQEILKKEKDKFWKDFHALGND
jgi:hypothetical protein